ncbi:hypothetical protein TSOC_007019 [Tetrabaena socialis]|uniref:Uncharacterized protein n=1 Tax=Tetrabaena socialis TaxID=47790 RepID=A0A2J8A234_9CHLO|nr:hypothetical protein TSOC_007019 [Tetrabaena socialis]|eukprot:PNH06577.1 hypothetical protein TSOC_007019 [Tetrabaena socialis]
MLDHLDWMNPLQLAAAAFGIRHLRLPYAVRDNEVPHGVRQYRSRDRLPLRDARCLAGAASSTVVPAAARSKSQRGRMWPVLFDQMMGFMLLLELFSGAVLLTNGGLVAPIILWATLTPALVAFWRHCRAYHLAPLHHPPLTMVASEPPAWLDPLVYMPPALRPGAVGWYPEQGKVWEKYGIPKHY